MPKNILLIDKDEAFGTVMLEAIEESGDFEVKLFTSATAALTALKQTPFDLVILDQGVDDVPLPHIIRGARMLRANIPVLIMPYDGSEVPRELAPLGLQGGLSKIFFRMDLPHKIEAALGITTSAAPAGPGVILPQAPAPPPVTPAPRAQPAARPAAMPPAAETPRATPPATPRAGTAESPAPDTRPKLQLKGRAGDEISYYLRTLAQELSAEAALFIYAGDLIASAGMIQRARVAEVATALDTVWAALQRLGALAGDNGGVVQVSIEGKERSVYSLRISAHGAIAVIVPAGTSPGSIRLRAREAANSIEMLVS